MSRLPIPGSDNDQWGEILNDFLSQSHSPDGTLKTNSVGSSQLQDGTVTNVKIANTAAIAKTKLASDVQTSLDAADNAIPSIQKGVANGVASLDNTGKVPAGQLPATTIADGSVTTNKLADGAVSEVKLDSSVQTKLNNPIPADGSITSAKIADATITNGDISASAAIAQSKLALSITDTEVAANAGIAQSKINNLTTDLASKATDSTVVHLAGTETITGSKTFSTTVEVSGSLFASGSMRQHRRAVSTDDAVTSSDFYVGVTSTAAQRTLTLPDSADATVANRPSAGQVFEIKDESNGAGVWGKNIIIQSAGSDTFLDGGTARAIRTNRGYWRGMWTGTNWVTIGGTTEMADLMNFGANDQNLIGWTSPPDGTSGQGAPGAGTMYVQKVKVVKNSTISNILLYVQTVGTGATSLANCYVGVYEALPGTSARLGVSADQAANWNSPNVAGLRTIALTPTSAGSLNVKAGQFIYVAILIGTQSTTTCQIARISGGLSALLNAGLLQTDGFRSSNVGSGMSSLPTSVTPPTFSGSNPIAFWQAVN